MSAFYPSKTSISSMPFTPFHPCVCLRPCIHSAVSHITCKLCLAPVAHCVLLPYYHCVQPSIGFFDVLLSLDRLLSFTLASISPIGFVRAQGNQPEAPPNRAPVITHPRSGNNLTISVLPVFQSRCNGFPSIYHCSKAQLASIGRHACFRICNSR